MSTSVPHRGFSSLYPHNLTPLRPSQRAGFLFGVLMLLYRKILWRLRYELRLKIWWNEKRRQEGRKEKVMAKGQKHYMRDGTEHKGGTHKDAKGRLMSGARHTASSKFLYHLKDLSPTAKKKAKK